MYYGIYHFFELTVPKYLSPKSPIPGARKLISFNKIGSTYAVIIFIFGCVLNNFYNPISQLTRVNSVMFSSFTPWDFNILIAKSALPPVANIGSTNITYYSWTFVGNF